MLYSRRHQPHTHRMWCKDHPLRNWWRDEKRFKMRPLNSSISAVTVKHVIASYEESAKRHRRPMIWADSHDGKLGRWNAKILRWRCGPTKYPDRLRIVNIGERSILISIQGIILDFNFTERSAERFLPNHALIRHPIVRCKQLGAGEYRRLDAAKHQQNQGSHNQFEDKW